MKRLLSLVLSVCVIVSAFAFTGVNAYAAESKYNAQKQQFNTQNASFNFDGDKYVRVKYTDKAEIYLADNFGKTEKLVTKEGSVAYPTIKGSYIYWINYAKGAIVRCKTNGKGKKTVLKFNVDTQGIKYIISGKKLIYLIATFDENNGEMKSVKLYSASLTGKSKKLIAKGLTGYSFYTYKNKVYFIKSNKLYSYSFKTKKTVMLKKGFKNAQINSMEGANLYFFTYTGAESGESYVVKKINVSNKKVSKIGTVKTDGSVWSMITSNSGVFVITNTTDGDKAFGKLKNGKIDYSTYRKKYDKAGDELAYYKNYIVFDENKVGEEGFDEGVGYMKIVKIN